MRFTPTLRRLASATLCCLGLTAQAAELHVYNWSDYIGEQTIASFEKQTGIKVKYATNHYV
jgi:putrescine transport system substrate-binding protein